MNTDDFIQFICSSARQVPAVERIYLFGSRADGTAGERSDYDLAFELSDATDWGRFAGELRENNPTLNSLDLVRLDEINDAFHAVILKTGRIIYEKTPKKP